MAAFPAQVTTATVTAVLTSAVVDGSDVDLLPDAVPLSGQVTFTPDRVNGQLMVPTATPQLMVTVKPMPFTLAGDGSLSANLVVIPGATYTVSFALSGVRIAPFSIGPLVAGTTYDLASLAPTVAMDGVAYTIGPATDASIATAVSTSGTATRTALDAAFAAKGSVATPTRPAGRLAALGDSIVRAEDNEPGIIIGGSPLTSFAAGASWFTWCLTLSGGRLIRGRNAGITGNHIAEMDARVQVDVCDFSPKIGTCIVYSGVNDALSSITPAAFLASLTSIVGKLRAAGIVPVLATPMPYATGYPAVTDLLIRYALVIRKYATDNGFLLLDFQAWTTDPITGAQIAAVINQDGIHPSSLGHKWLGQKVSDALLPFFPPTANMLQVSPLDLLNLAPNGLFSGTPTAGLAPNIGDWGAQTGVTLSVVTDPLVPGSMQRMTHAGSTVERKLSQNLNYVAGMWNVGDVLEFSGVITTSGVTATVGVGLNSPPYGANVPLWVAHDVTRGYYCVRVPTVDLSGIGVLMLSGPGTGTADFGQVTVRNLTALGIT